MTDEPTSKPPKTSKPAQSAPGTLDAASTDSPLLALGDSTPERILSAVMGQVSERGIGSMTVQHILNASGFSRRTFYKFFSGKEQALDVLYGRLIDALMDRFRQSAATFDDPIASLSASARVYLNIQRLAGGFALALHNEATRPGSPLGPRREAALDALIAFFISELRRNTDVAPIDPLMVRGWVLGLEGMVTHLHRQGGLDEAGVDRLHRIFMASVVRTLADNDDPDLPPLPEFSF